MADNKVIFTLEIQQKGQTLSVVQKQTDKLAKSTQNVENAEGVVLEDLSVPMLF